MKKIKLAKKFKYSVDACGTMKMGCMTSAEYRLENGVTMILVAEGWSGDSNIDAAAAEINELISQKSKVCKKC